MRTAAEFARATGWTVEAGTMGRISRALAFYRMRVPLGYLHATVHDPGPWAVRVNGRVTNLCVLMQAINFAGPVDVVMLARGRRLVSYRTFGRTFGDGRMGRWFTDPGTPRRALAIAADQVWAREVEVVRGVWALRSRVGDNYVDWARSRGVREGYQHGGGWQYYLWDAGGCMREVGGER